MNDARDLCKFKYKKKEENDPFVEVDTVGIGGKILVNPDDLPNEIELRSQRTNAVFCGTSQKCVALNFYRGFRDVNGEFINQWDNARVGSIGIKSGDSGGPELIGIHEYENRDKYLTDVALGGIVRAGTESGNIAYTSALPHHNFKNF